MMDLESWAKRKKDCSRGSRKQARNQEQTNKKLSYAGELYTQSHRQWFIQTI